MKFFDWAFENGQKLAEELDYVPLPAALVAQIEARGRRDQGFERQGGLELKSRPDTRASFRAATAPAPLAQGSSSA